MSDKKIQTTSNSSIQDIIETQQAYKDIHEKEKQIYAHNVEVKFDELVKIKQEVVLQKEFDLKNTNHEYIKKMQKDTVEYLQLAKTAQVFLDNDTFKSVVPFFSKNIILIGAKSGDGKSTTCANIAYSAIRKGKKILIISNEENASDVYNRITCLIDGIPYTNHMDFSQKQIHHFADNIKRLSERVTVVDDSWGDGIGMTTTIEGMTTILEHLQHQQVNFDIIVWDYYQKVNRSTKNPTLSPFEVQARFADLLDNFKNTYPGVLVVLAQIKPNTKDEEAFEYRIQGRKIIYQKATCAIECRAERDKLATSWTIHKSRWNDSVGKELYTGYKRGKYVEYDASFETQADMQKIIKETSKKRIQEGEALSLDEVLFDEE